MRKATKIFLLLAIVCGIGYFSFLINAYSYHLIHREQMLLFTYTVQQIQQYLHEPAVLSCLGGDFLTQFLHLHVMGPAIVASTLVILMVLAYFTSRRWTNSWVSGGVVLLLFVWEGLRFCDISYPLASTLSIIGALALFLLMIQISNKKIYTVLLLLCIPISYVCFGYGVFIFGILSLLEIVTHRKVYVGSSLVLAISVGIILYLSTNKYLMMPANAFSYPATVWMGKPNFSNERILGLNTEYYHNNWNKINELVFQGEPSNDVAVCYNLANAMNGQLSNRLMHYYQPAGLGLFMPIDEESTYLSTQLAGEVWFRLGDMTMAEHAAILSMIFSPNNKNVRMLKRMAEINLINGDEDAAMKYLQILSKTLYYKEWATERMPGKQSESFKKWLNNKRTMIPQQDTLRLSATDVVKSLHVLLETNPNNQLACEYLLCFDLLMKDLPSFIKDYERYYKGKPNRLYSEALMIHFFQQHANAKEVKNSGITPSVVQEFNQYNRIYNQSQGNGSALQSKFGKTYWFYYQFAKFD